MQETQVLSLGLIVPMEKEMAIHSSILPWVISWTEEPGGPQSMGLQRVRHYLRTKQQLQQHCIEKESRNRSGGFLMVNIHWKDWCWSWSSNTLATWCEQPTHWKRPWCWGRLRAGEVGDRGWDCDGHNLSKRWKTVKDREAWRVVVLGVAKGWTRLGDHAHTNILGIYSGPESEGQKVSLGISG